MDDERLVDVAEAAIVLDAARVIRAVNEPAIALLGYARDELLGRVGGQLVAFGPSWMEQEWRMLLEQGTWRGDVAVRPKGGGLRHLTVELTLARQAGEVRIVARMFPR